MNHFPAFNLWSMLLILPISLFGSGKFSSGGRAAGLGNASVALHDTWSVSHNQAGMMRTGGVTAALYTENRFLLPELSLAGFAVILPFSGSVLGVSFSGFGNSLYREGKTGVAYARSFGERLSTGLKISYHFASIADGSGHHGTAVAELGVVYEPVPGLLIASHVFNPTMAGRPDCPHSGSFINIPTVIRTGFSYRFSDNVLLSMEAGKDIRLPPVFRAGVEYAPGEAIVMRTGVSTNPFQNAFGIGFRRGRLQIDIATAYHYTLGYSPCVAMTYTLH